MMIRLYFHRSSYYMMSRSRFAAVLVVSLSSFAQPFSFIQTSKSRPQGTEEKKVKTPQGGKPTKAAAQPTPAPSPAPGQIDEKLFGAMRWRQVGPCRGGRVLAVTGVPGGPCGFSVGVGGGAVCE